MERILARLTHLVHVLLLEVLSQSFLISFLIMKLFLFGHPYSLDVLKVSRMEELLGHIIMVSLPHGDGLRFSGRSSVFVVDDLQRLAALLRGADLLLESSQRQISPLLLLFSECFTRAAV